MPTKFRFVRVSMDPDNPQPIPADETCVYPYGFYAFTEGALQTFLDMMKAQAPDDNEFYEVRTSDGVLAYKKGDLGYKFLVRSKQFLII